MNTAAGITTKFDEILVATDFSQEAERALAFAKAIARSTDGELLLVHVARPMPHVFVPEGGWIEDDVSRLEREEAEAEATGIGLRAEGLKARSICDYGGVAAELAVQSKENHANLVVIGTHGRHGLTRLLTGSHAESVIGSVQIPVLVVGPKCPPPTSREWKPQNILCILSLDRESVHTAAFACTLAANHAASLAVIYSHAARKGSFENWIDFKKAVSHSLASEAGSRQAMHAVPLDQADPSVMIDLAIARDVDLVVLGAHHKLFDWPSLGSGTLSRILAEAPCPVITVPVQDQT